MNVVIFNLLLIACAAYALAKGGMPEKLVTCSILFAAALTRLSLPPLGVRYRSVDLPGFIIDLALLAILFMIALRANRYWPLCFCALHLASVYAYLARTLSPGMTPNAMRILLAYGAYLQLAILVVGTVRHRKRLQQFGLDQPWS